jgi:hypothetical protein
LKREGGGEWSVNDLADLLTQAPAGSTCVPIELTDETLILHFKVPKDWSHDDHDKMAKWFRDQLKPVLPDNVFGLITNEDVDLDVHRPGQADLVQTQEALVALAERVDIVINWVGTFVKDYDSLVETVNQIIKLLHAMQTVTTASSTAPWPQP